MRSRKIDWELVTCGLKGHFLIGTDAAQLREEDFVLAREEGDHRLHHCLRCDCWVVLAPPAVTASQHPPGREEIELPLRGKALRDKIVLRLIAIDRALHFVILGLLGFAVLALAANERSLRNTFYRVLTDLQGGVAGGPVQNSGHVGIIGELDKLFSLRTGTLREVGIALLLYAALEGVEAVGLWFAKRWAEYLTVLATSLLVPLEVYEIANRASPLKIIGFIINVAVVVYLLFAKRLFGLRGGGAAEEAERMREQGWEAIERAVPWQRPLRSAQDAGGSAARS